MKLIGIAGTNGSGKDTLGELLAHDHQWLFVSVADMLSDEARKRGQPIEREVLRTISAEWRRKYGLGVLVDKAVELFNESPGMYKGLVVVPMRNPGEAQHLKDLGGTLVWIDADPKVRYERITQRQRSTEDKKTFEQFIAEEQAEMQHSGDAATLSMADVKAKADIFVQNDSNDAEAFKLAAEGALQLK
jgi:dephospho-CoA kinase